MKTRHIQSIVIVKTTPGYECTVRSTNPRHDFVLYRKSKQVIYDALERRIRDR